MRSDDPIAYQINFPDALEQLVELYENIAESLIHQEHHKGDDQGSNGYDNRTTLKFTPGWPGNLMHEFIITFPEVRNNF